jgi:oligoribonuclease NrnB/cAMP/cGMP phosphodiesterase (DHH superfamily)
MKTACIYHSIDLDGWMSAAIVKYWFEKTMPKGIEYTFAKPMNDGQSGKKIWHSQYDNCKILNFIGYNYGDTIPDLSDYDKVIMCDISFPKEEMEKLRTKLTWIDHHISALNQNGHLDYDGIQRTDFAACELTWQYFFPE